MSDDMVIRCRRDLARGMVKECLEVETPGGSVSQDDLHDITVGVDRYVEQRQILPDVIGPWRLQLEFRIEAGSEVSKDLYEVDQPVVVYGADHVWWLGDPRQSSITVDGHTLDDEVLWSDHEHEWKDIEHIDWRDN